METENGLEARVRIENWLGIGAVALPGLGCVVILLPFMSCQARRMRRVLKTYAGYYNNVRTHLSLDKDAPNSQRPQTVGRVIAMPILGGLHRQYFRVWV